MNQAPLEILLRKSLLELLPPELGLPVVLGNQVKSQGRVENGIYFFRIGSPQPGWQHRSYKAEDTLTLTETQWMESQYQIQALITEDPNDPEPITAADVTEIARMVVSSLAFVERMTLAGVGVQRASDILTPTFVNDQDQYEANPNFTVIFTHRREMISVVPHITPPVTGTITTF